MKPIDYFIIVIIALTMVAVAIYIIRKKIKGEKIGCGCGCASCPHANTCGGVNATEREKEEICDCGKNVKKENDGEKDNDETL